MNTILIVIPESFTHNSIALAFVREEAISSTVQCFYLAVEAPAAVNQLDP